MRNITGNFLSLYNKVRYLFLVPENNSREYSKCFDKMLILPSRLEIFCKRFANKLCWCTSENLAELLANPKLGEKRIDGLKF